MEKWLEVFDRALKQKMPVIAVHDPNVYDYRINHMGAEREHRGFDQISVCVDERFKQDLDVFKGALKRADKYLMRLYNQQQYQLFAIMQDGSFEYVNRTSQPGYFKLKFEERFKKINEKKWPGADPFKPKKASLCLLITDRNDFSLPEEKQLLLKRKYSKIIILNFSSEEKIVMSVK